MGDFIQRLIGVFLLREQTFENIGTNKDLTGQAFLVELMVALAGAISAATTAAILGLSAVALNSALSVADSLVESSLFRVPTMNPVSVFFSAFVGVFISWLLWALVTYLIGTYVFKGDTTFSEMLRIIGFAQAPRLISLLGIIPIPFFGLLTSLVGWVWAVIATFIGVRQGLELDNGKAMLTIVVSLVVIFFVQRWLVVPLMSSIF